MDIICHDALFLFFCIIGPVHDPAEVIHLGVFTVSSCAAFVS